MELRTLMTRAVDTSVEVVQGIGPEMLDRPTPCPEYDVRALLGHLSGWMTGPARAAAIKASVEGAPNESYDVTAGPGWADRFAEEVRATAAAWSEPAAWEGSSSLSGAMQMPAEMLGGLVFSEFLLHGWDLAAATGQKLGLDDDLARALFDQVSSMAGMAREYRHSAPKWRSPRRLRSRSGHSASQAATLPGLPDPRPGPRPAAASLPQALARS
jgi:uncharacterized protein (TIGR03086 family)